jgi:hypothetical protein
MRVRRFIAPFRASLSLLSRRCETVGRRSTMVDPPNNKRDDDGNDGKHSSVFSKFQKSIYSSLRHYFVCFLSHEFETSGTICFQFPLTVFTLLLVPFCTHSSTTAATVSPRAANANGAQTNASELDAQHLAIVANTFFLADDLLPRVCRQVRVVG